MENLHSVMGKSSGWNYVGIKNNGSRCMRYYVEEFVARYIFLEYLRVMYIVQLDCPLAKY